MKTIKLNSSQKDRKEPVSNGCFSSHFSKLAATLATGPIGDETFICNKRKKSSKKALSTCFVKPCNQAGIKKSAHGLRKLAATRAANSGTTVLQMKALFGWTEDSRASLYPKSADRKKLALESIKKLQKVQDRL
ncbi:hypothetical protein H704_00822 [Bartonella bacilliformis Peru38]|uniref:tyrosine-type recombinase/integrase n=1 Tax=Bartonella bacilliformis TaxID=774 RepID=UPI0004454DC4|nr:hypothetical protein X470_00917 [Bartonella bacilliformis Peru-18]KEG16228.1 hypothetical protein H709_00811 [Bartonella bacilliformis CUSCO5]KEG16932.1 hypothetical protein H705_00822 [Bartonella bacilliformis Cond044]KEG20176.1 hypothetical protein H704_00822 [Bartonella bacilliformis Peru38]KEG22958.1 hypothetical protein H703_00809 [Bartonella bacilliformis Ver075]